MNNITNATSPKGKDNYDKESLLKFMQDADCLDSLSKWTNEFIEPPIIETSRCIGES